MARIDFSEREIRLRIVYFGATQSGTSSNVRQLHRLLSPRELDPLRHSGGGDADQRVWHFSYLPRELIEIHGFTVRVEARSIAAVITPEARRDEAFEGVDAVVFIADARTDNVRANLDALVDLRDCLERHGLEPLALPMVVQVNHTDAANSRDVNAVAEDVNPWGFPVERAVARNGEGVLETHRVAVSAALSRLHDRIEDGAIRLSTTALLPAARSTASELVDRHMRGLQTSATLERTITRRADGFTPIKEIRLHSRELRGHRITRLVRAQLRGPQLHIDANIERERDFSTRRVRFVLGASETRTHEMPPQLRGSTKPIRVDTVMSDTPEAPGGPVWLYVACTVLGGVGGALLLYIFT